MSQDFDQFPVYDALIKSGSTYMSDVWTDFMATFYMNLIGYLTQGGILLPLQTTAQRDALQNPTKGQMIYNTTVGAAQIFQEGSWKTVTTA